MTISPPDLSRFVAPASRRRHDAARAARRADADRDSSPRSSVPILGRRSVEHAISRAAARKIAAGTADGKRSDARGNTHRDTRVAARPRASHLSDRTRCTHVHALPLEHVEMKLFTAQSDLINDNHRARSASIPDGGSNGGRVTLAAGERKYEVDVDWLTGRVSRFWIERSSDAQHAIPDYLHSPGCRCAAFHCWRCWSRS